MTEYEGRTEWMTKAELAAKDARIAELEAKYESGEGPAPSTLAANDESSQGCGVGGYDLAERDGR